MHLLYQNLLTQMLLFWPKKLSTVGIGVGQTNRIDSAKQAIQKNEKTNFGQVEAVMASDGFFPFPDIVKICSKNNIKNIIQPGGSLNDNLRY